MDTNDRSISFYNGDILFVTLEFFSLSLEALLILLLFDDPYILISFGVLYIPCCRIGTAWVCVAILNPSLPRGFSSRKVGAKGTYETNIGNVLLN